MTMAEHGFVGRGLSFPMQIDHTGGVGLTAGGDDIEGSIRMVLATAPGERVMRPRFGCRIWDLLFEPINANTIGLMAEAVREALAEWEPRAQIEDVTVRADTDDVGRVDISVSYRIRTTNDRRNLVYPFYVIPRDEEEEHQ